MPIVGSKRRGQILVVAMSGAGRRRAMLLTLITG
jgi:hypothetical protein